LTVFYLDSACTCRFTGAIACKMTLFPALEASTCTMIFLVFLFSRSFADYRKIHGVIVSGRKTRTRRLRSVPLSAPILIVGICVPSGALPDPTRVLFLWGILAGVSSRIASSILRV